jgi:hypothetical protein
MCSSVLFLIPAIYALLNQLYIISCIITICSIISFIFWSNPENNDVRDLDIMFARICFTVMFIHGIVYYDFSNTAEVLMTYILLSLVIHSFIGSHYFHGNNNIWIFYHCFFHINCTLLKSITIKNIM